MTGDRRNYGQITTIAAQSITLTIAFYLLILLAGGNAEDANAMASLFGGITSLLSAGRL